MSGHVSQSSYDAFIERADNARSVMNELASLSSYGPCAQPAMLRAQWSDFVTRDYLRLARPRQWACKTSWSQQFDSCGEYTWNYKRERIYLSHKAVTTL